MGLTGRTGFSFVPDFSACLPHPLVRIKEQMENGQVMTSRRHFINVSNSVTVPLTMGATLAGSGPPWFSQSKPWETLLNVSFDRLAKAA
jgi:hypothetical protein